MKDITVTKSGAVVVDQTKRKAKQIQVTQQQRIAILGDISSSMRGEKLSALKRTYKDVMQKRPNALYLVFHDDVFEVTPNDLPHLQAEASTNMLEPLQIAWAEYATHIILMTDGRPTWQTQGKIIQVVMTHHEVPIDTVGIYSATRGGKDYDPEFLKEISRITGGTFFECGEPLKLPEVVESLLLLQEGKETNQKGGVIQL